MGRASSFGLYVTYTIAVGVVALVSTLAAAWLQQHLAQAHPAGFPGSWFKRW